MGELFGRTGTWLGLSCLLLLLPLLGLLLFFLSFGYFSRFSLFLYPSPFLPFVFPPSLCFRWKL